MPLLSFSDPAFPDLIWTGRKTQTIRPFSFPRARQFSNNKTLYLWYKSRRPERYRIGTAILSEFFFVRLDETGPVNLKDEGEDIDPETFALKDGFGSYGELYEWFSRHYADLRKRCWIVIRWDFGTLRLNGETETTSPELKAPGGS